MGEERGCISLLLAFLFPSCLSCVFQSASLFASRFEISNIETIIVVVHSMCQEEEV